MSEEEILTHPLGRSECGGFGISKYLKLPNAITFRFKKFKLIFPEFIIYFLKSSNWLRVGSFDKSHKEGEWRRNGMSFVGLNLNRISSSSGFLQSVVLWGQDCSWLTPGFQRWHKALSFLIDTRPVLFQLVHPVSYFYFAIRSFNNFNTRDLPLRKSISFIESNNCFVLPFDHQFRGMHVESHSVLDPNPTL